MGGTFRVGGALIVGAILVGGAFLAHSMRKEEAAGVAAIPTWNVQQTIHEERDRDADGIPDWLEELRGTDPLTPNESGAIVAAENGEESYTTPTTLTGRFGQTFFEDYVRLSGGATLDDEDQAQFVLSTVSELEQASRPDLFTRADIHISLEDDLTSIRNYGNTLGQLIVDNTVTTDDPLLLLQRALEAEDFSGMAKLEDLEASYARIIEGMQTMPVPAPVIEEHMTLLNVYGAILEDTRAIRAFEGDPLLGLLKVKQYQSDMDTRLVALNAMRGELERAGIVYTNDEYGLFFFILRP